jgi:hypothetical protein
VPHTWHASCFTHLCITTCRFGSVVASTLKSSVRSAEACSHCSSSWRKQIPTCKPGTQAEHGKAPVGRRQKLWAAKARTELTNSLGGRCSACGSVEHLQFDCDPVDSGAHHHFEPSVKMCFYRQQARLGRVRLLCGLCNSLKGDLPMLDWCAALAFVATSELVQRGSYTPGEGTAFNGWRTMQSPSALCRQHSRTSMTRSSTSA